MKSFLALVFIALLAGGLSAGCLEFDVDSQPYICIDQQSCGEGFACLRGEGCYCMCLPQGSTPQSCTGTNNLPDPTCQFPDVVK